jgi:hypothetical protein
MGGGGTWNGSGIGLTASRGEGGSKGGSKGGLKGGSNGAGKGLTNGGRGC